MGWALVGSHLGTVEKSCSHFSADPIHGPLTYQSDVYRPGHRPWHLWQCLPCLWVVECDLHFYPVYAWVVLGEPVVAQYHQIFLVQLSDKQFHCVQLTSGKCDGDAACSVDSRCCGTVEHS